VLLRNEEDLKGSSKERLEKLTIMNTPLSQAYILKEDTSQIWMKKIGHEPGHLSTVGSRPVGPPGKKF
jgi:hypothetical protein